MTGFPRFIGAAIGVALLLVASVAGVRAEPSALEQQLAGNWRLSQDGAKGDGLGPNANGLLMFAGGNFSVQIVNTDMTPFGSDDRRNATSG